MRNKSFLTILFSIFSTAIVYGQIATSQNFTLEKAVISNGGGTSQGTSFSVEGTMGQPSSGASARNLYWLDGGFWNSNFAPTAANISISGRVLTSDGRGLTNAGVLLTDATGNTRTVPLRHIVKIGAAGEAALALKKDGTVYGFGRGGKFAYEQIRGLQNIREISIGLYHAMALDADGNVWTWANDDSENFRRQSRFYDRHELLRDQKRRHAPDLGREKQLRFSV